MRNFVQSIKSFFRGKKRYDEDIEEEQAKENQPAKKFSISCSRKKKKTITKVHNSSKEKTETKGQAPIQEALAGTQRTQNNSTAQSVPQPTLVMNLLDKQKSAIGAMPSTVDMSSRGNLLTQKNVTLKVEPKKISSKESQYMNVPKSKSKGRFVQSRSFDIESRASSVEGTSSLRRFKEFSARAIRKVKTFVSRPVNEATLKKVAHRVEQRKKMEAKQLVHPMTHGEDIFPKQKPLGLRKKTTRSSEVFTPVQTKADEKNVITVGSLPSGTILIKNNDNNGELFVEKRGAKCPFWMATRRPNEEESEGSETEDDLQLNAEVVLDVMDGKVKLVNMPSIPVILDPLNDMTQLQRRDKLFFNRDVLFGNTVRTMINLSDQTSVRVQPKRRKTNWEQLKFMEPGVYMSYKGGSWSDFTQEKFIPRNNIPPQTE